jgi:hypothetical protein
MADVQKWEYMADLILLDMGKGPFLDPFINSADDLLMRSLNGRGKQGWELVSVILVNADRLRAVFKRPTY